MNLKSLRIENFKAFGKNPRAIPIKPITLVFGSNSAGKSSLLHSLLWLNHAVSRGETDVYHPTLSGQSVNLGGFKSCLNRNTIADHLKYSIEVEHSNLKFKDIEKPRWIDSISRFTLTFVVRRPSKDQIPRLSAFKILGDDIELLTAWSSAKDKRGEFSSKINFEHPAMPFTSSADDVCKEQLASINSHGAYDLQADDFLPRRMELNFLSELLVVVDSNSNFKRHLSFLVKEFPSGMIGLFADLSSMIRGIQYLPPLRVIPDRSMDIRSCELPGWRSLGKRPELLDKVNGTLKLLKFE
ncbi:MAG: AAA family ATPase, partial [Armatimonadetes bacterium]|nr:AAA family ATPase [Akkermansiaceae bacterium]